MKNSLIAIVALLSSVAVLQSTAISSYADTELTFSNDPHIYEIQPGTLEWQNLSPKERLESCKVTEGEVSIMSTSALVETVLNYPYLANMYAYNTIEDGIEAVSNHFPGIKELLTRPDVAEALQVYNTNNTEDNFKMTVVKSLLGLVIEIKPTSFTEISSEPIIYLPLASQTVIDGTEKNKDRL